MAFDKELLQILHSANYIIHVQFSIALLLLFAAAEILILNAGDALRLLSSGNEIAAGRTVITTSAGLLVYVSCHECSITMYYLVCPSRILSHACLANFGGRW